MKVSKGIRGGKRVGAGRPKGNPTLAAPFRVYVDDSKRYLVAQRMSGLSSAEYFKRIWIDFCTVTRD